MTIPPLTAAELFDVVKDCPEVWATKDSGLIYRVESDYWEHDDDWISPKIATLTLLALFTLAAECGVNSCSFSSGHPTVWGAFTNLDPLWVQRGAENTHPLSAAVAAYKKKGAERGV
jgi:hypothetical protein